MVARFYVGHHYLLHIYPTGAIAMKSLLGMIVGLGVGVIWGMILLDDRPTPPAPPEHRVMPLSMGEVPAFPMEIRISIVSSKDFNRSMEVRSLMATQKMDAVGGYTLTDSNPCRIVIPDNFKIFVVAQEGSAWFDDSMGQIVAHEILHCLYGSWHKPWNVIQSKSSLALPKANTSQH